MKNEVSRTKNQSLSKEQLQKEGVEIKITQNDIIDVLVQERVQNLEREYLAIREEYANLIDEASQEAEKAVDDKVRAMVFPKKCVIKKIEARYKAPSKNSGILVRELISVGIPLQPSYNKPDKIYGPSKTYFSASCICYGTVHLSMMQDDIEFSAQIYIPDFTIKHSKSYMKRIEAHEKRAQTFLDSLPESKMLSEKEIARSIKNMFTKEMLKNMSPEFVETMRKGFAMNI